MAEHALLQIPRGAPTAEQRKREDQRRRHDLRIAVRQLERAELYVVALNSLSLEDREAKASVDDLLGRVRSLQRYLFQLKVTA
jgi:CHAD domain-containing protein